MASTSGDTACTAFLGEKMLKTGQLRLVVSDVKDNLEDNQISQLLIFDDGTGKLIDIDFRGTKLEVLQRLDKNRGKNGASTHDEVQEPRRAGRPKLGVVPGEVTLLPRHWEWLKSQPGGASVTMRKLVDEARRDRAHADTLRQAQEATYRFMTVMAGDRPHYEEALRALYAQDLAAFHRMIDSWAVDVRDHVRKLAKSAFPEE